MIPTIAYPYLKDKDFLKILDEQRVKEIFVKIIVLDRDEDIVEEIQGKVSSGQLNIDGSSSIRRTGNLTFVPNESEGNLTDANNIISINKKVQVSLGYTNTLKEQYHIYSEYDIIWFPLGTYIITDANMSQSTTETSISIELKDKMCLLNGDCGGTFSAAPPRFDILEYEAGGETVEEPIPIYRIIREVVNHFGEESLSRIIISDVEDKRKQIMKWAPSQDFITANGGNSILYMYNGANENEVILNMNSAGAWIKNIVPQTNAGYIFTDLTYPGELVVDAGGTVCDVLDKIRDALGNYEYFYDLEGNFRFQEIKNYLNISHSTMLINDMKSSDYSRVQGLRSRSVYDFEDSNLITAFNNSPSYASIKNDFVVWGKKALPSGESYPFRYHLAIDEKPIPLIAGEDWRNVLYKQGLAAEPYGLQSNAYFIELQNEWPKIYNPQTLAWVNYYVENPHELDYFLDFIDTAYSLKEISIKNIGRRTKVVVDDNVNCVFAPKTDDIIIILGNRDLPSPETSIEIQLAQDKQMRYAVVPPEIYDNFKLGTDYLDAFSVVRDLLYQHTNYNTAISLQTIPIYHLDANTRISVYDKKSGTNGDFMIQSISVPIAISDQMSITANAVLERI